MVGWSMNRGCVLTDTGPDGVQARVAVTLQASGVCVPAVSMCCPEGGGSIVLLFYT